MVPRRIVVRGGPVVSAKTILVAEDDPVTRSVVTRVLTDNDWEVIAAEDGEEALEAWSEHQPQLVLTDYMMPGLDGAELCKHIRAESTDQYTYIIVLTSRDDQKAVVTGLEAGADDYIKKPFEKTELLLRVKAGRRVIKLQADLAQKVRELEDALDRVRTLEGILPTCSYCGSIRDEDGTWSDLEGYVRTRTKAEFSHGYCPSCLKEHVLPQFDEPPPELLRHIEDADEQ
jgi:CheY-like chemotaxis protein